MDLERRILKDGDREILEQYDDYNEISDSDDFQRYLQAFARLVIAISQDGSYRMGKVQRITGIGNEVGRGEMEMSEGKAEMDELDVSAR